ncbi:MAG: translation initiation factor IF-2 [Bacillota bacterium]
MGEQAKKQENVLANLSKIASFEGQHLNALASNFNKQKAAIAEALSLLAGKRVAINKDIDDKLVKKKEKELQMKAQEEAIKKEMATPIVNEDEAPKKVVEVKAEPKVEAVAKPVVEKQTVAAVETPVVAEQPAKTVSTDTKSAEKPVTPTDAADRLRKQAHQINESIFGSPKKKSTIEKPVIKIYIPQEQPVRPKRPPRDAQQGPQGARPPYNRNGAGAMGGRPPYGQQGGGYNSDRNQNSGGVSRPAGGMMGGGMPMMPSRGPDKNKRNDRTHVRASGEDHTLSKKSKIKKGFEGGSQAIVYDEISGEIKKIRSRKTATKKQSFIMPQLINITHAAIDEVVTIKTLSEKIGKTGSEIIKTLFLLGIIKTINDRIDFATAELVAGELGVTLELQHQESSEEKVIASHDEIEDTANLVARPPIVTVMGHVDHGKTSILDNFRNANVVSGEAGGITQHIGAYSTMLDGQKITFLDTPGHAAFTAMRQRGATATDIAIIVVAADDGIMPQTIEAIAHAKAAEVSIIVAINKMDRPGADPDRVLTQLSEYDLLAEEWGGTVPVVRVSAKTGMGMNDLLSTILITAEVMELRANPNRAAKGTIVEARLDKGRGPMATVLVQNGTLKVGDYIIAGTVTGKVRAMVDDKGKAVKKAGPSSAVSIHGLQEVPNAGDQLMVVSDDKLMKQVLSERINREKANISGVTNVNLDDVFSSIAGGKMKNLNIIIKADVQGSVQALKESLVKLSNEEVNVRVVHGVAGAINESDVTLADTTKAIIIGFNVRPDAKARAIADKNNIDIRIYRVIYDAIDDVTKAIKGLLAPKFREQYLGKAEVRAIYKISSIGTIAGVMVKDGKIVRNAKVRVLRDNIVIKETSISSLKRMKDDAKEVNTGYECGIGLDDFNDIKEGDIIESFSIVQEEV